jgi:hypothetical protein
MAAKPATRTAKAAGQTRSEHREHDMEFTFAPVAQRAIVAALKGLDGRQRERVLDAVDEVSGDVARKIAKAIERNVIANANELLAVLAPAWAKEARWPELRAILLFLERLDVPVHHGRLAKAVEKAGGPQLAARWREETERRTSSQ